MQTESRTATTTQKPTTAAVVTHKVADYAAWKKVFDEHEGARRAAGIVAHHINRSAADPNLLSVYLAASDAGRLAAFFADADLAATMKRAGVVGPPTIVRITPVEDLTVKRDPLPGAIVVHDVADFAAWKTAFDGHGETRARAGIIGAAVNRVIDQPNRVVVYLQADRAEALQAFIDSPDLEQTMQKAGVVGAPTITLVTGDGWASY